MAEESSTEQYCTIIQYTVTCDYCFYLYDHLSCSEVFSLLRLDPGPWSRLTLSLHWLTTYDSLRRNFSLINFFIAEGGLTVGKNKTAQTSQFILLLF